MCTPQHFHFLLPWKEHTLHFYFSTRLYFSVLLLLLLGSPPFLSTSTTRTKIILFSLPRSLPPKSHLHSPVSILPKATVAGSKSELARSHCPVDPALSAPSLPPLSCSCSAFPLVRRIRSSVRRHGRQDLIRRGHLRGPLRSYLRICGSSRPCWDP